MKPHVSPHPLGLTGPYDPADADAAVMGEEPMEMPEYYSPYATVDDPDDPISDVDLPTVPIVQERPWLRATDAEFAAAGAVIAAAAALDAQAAYAAQADYNAQTGHDRGEASAFDGEPNDSESATRAAKDRDLEDPVDPIFLRSFGNFLRSFESALDCAEYVYTLRFPNGFCCPTCEVRSASESDDGMTLTCLRGHRFDLASGTVIEGSTVPIALWFRAAYVLITGHPDLSVSEFRERLGIARLDLALTLRSRLRSALSGNDKAPFSGEVELGHSVVLPDEGPPLVFAGALEIARWRDELGRTQEMGNRVALRVLPAWTATHALRFAADHIAGDTIIHTLRDPALDDLDRVGFERKVQCRSGVPRLDNLFSSLGLVLRSVAPGPLTPYRAQAMLNDYAWRFNRRGSRWAAFNRSLGLTTPAANLYEVDTLGWISRDYRRRPMAMAVGG